MLSFLLEAREASGSETARVHHAVRRRGRGVAAGGARASPNSGVVVTASTLAVVHRELIVTLAARHKLPAVYFDRVFAVAGGLISYGPDYISTGARPLMSIASSRARSRPTCRCRGRRNMSW